MDDHEILIFAVIRRALFNPQTPVDYGLK